MGDEFAGAEKMIHDTFLPHLLFVKTKSLSPILGALSKVPVNKSGLDLLNPVTPANKKYLSLQHASIELI